MPNFSKITSYEELMMYKQSMFEIGSGAFGVVYKFIAQDKEICAVKQICIPNDKYLQERIQQLEKEKNFLCKYHHKNIVKGYFGFISLIDTNFYYYLGMEFVENNLDSKLQRVINQKEVFTDETIFNYALQLCDALYFLQQKNVAHQDLKPLNIRIDNEGTIKICDFSEFRTEIDAYKSMLATEIGTRTYMAPERFAKNKKIIPIKADAYSYGVIILQCFLKCTSASIDCLNENNGENILNTLVSQFSEEMQYFFKKCTCHNLIERFDFLDIKIFLQAKLEKLSFKDKTEINELQTEIKILKQQKLQIKNSYSEIIQKYSNLENENKQLKSKQNQLENKVETLANLVSKFQQPSDVKKVQRRECDWCEKECDIDKMYQSDYGQYYCSQQCLHVNLEKFQNINF